MSKGSISKKEKSETLKRHKENEEEEEEDSINECTRCLHICDKLYCLPEMSEDFRLLFIL
jgi:hypothetical protein